MLGLIEGIGNQSRRCYVLLLLEEGTLDTLTEKWKRTAHISPVGEAVHVCRERKGASNSEEKKEWET